MATDRLTLRGRASPRTAPGGGVRSAASLPIDEIAGEYPGEWVLVKVTAQDAERGITHGQVLAHSRVRKKVSSALVKAHAAEPGVLTYLFRGGTPAATREEWSEQLAAAASLLLRRTKRLDA